MLQWFPFMVSVILTFILFHPPEKKKKKTFILLKIRSLVGYTDNQEKSNKASYGQLRRSSSVNTLIIDSIRVKIVQAMTFL